MDDDPERELFETTTSERLDGILDYTRDPADPDRYDDSPTDFAWEGWQAARSLPHPDAERVAHSQVGDERPLPEPFGYVMQWPAPGGGDELVFSRTDAAGKAIGCVIRPVFVDHQMRSFAALPPDAGLVADLESSVEIAMAAAGMERGRRQDGEKRISELERLLTNASHRLLSADDRIVELERELRVEKQRHAASVEALDENRAQWEAEAGALKAERDAAFAMSKCECSAAEACANLVAANAARDAALAQLAEARAEAALLDWLQDCEHSLIRIEYMGSSDGYALETWNGKLLGQGPNLRAAVDAARTKAEGEPT